MEIDFAFGRDRIRLNLPEGRHYSLVESRSAKPLADRDKSVADALEHPIGCAPLAELARGKRTAAIAVCDITRPAPNRITLQPLHERLHAAGIPPEGITLLVDSG